MRPPARSSPTAWVDPYGQVWPVPTCVGRLKMRIPSHQALRAYVIWRAGYQCQACGCTRLSDLVADHIVSRRNGGSHHPDNLQCLCHRCNSRKAALIDARAHKAA